MTRTRWHPRTCWVCGKSEEDGITVSASGLCVQHGIERCNENVYALKSKRGPFAQWWAYRLAASVGLAPLDEAPPRP